MVHKIVRFINQPFPSSNDLRDQVKEAAGVGFAIFAILFFLKPFGTGNLTTIEAFRVTASFGLLTFAMSLAYNVVLIKVLGFQYDKPTWTFAKWIVSTLILILLISIANFLFMSFELGFLGFGWQQFLYQVYMTFIIGIFPLIFFGTITMLRKEKYFRHIADDISSHQEQTVHKSELLVAIPNHTDKLHLNVDDILYIEAMQNYATVYLEDDKTEIIRTTIKSLEDLLKDYGIIRTHRSFLVNKQKVIEVSGNAQGLKLSLSGVQESIVPVSRGYIAKVKPLL